MAVESTKAKTRLFRCTCKHEFQDKKYGRGIRLHNILAPKNSMDYRCTVCKSEK